MYLLFVLFCGLMVAHFPRRKFLKTIGGAELPTWTYQPRTSDEKHAYPTLVTQVGSDGNELAGLRTPFLTVPLATHTGWNLRDPATGFATDRAPFAGSLIPFAKLPYASRDEYLGRFTSEVLRLIGERYVSADDLQFALPLAVQFWEWAAARP